jgi:Tol biopolymer transport system component/DNA-binding winged helix-turn-helix (wHTH) protein
MLSQSPIRFGLFEVDLKAHELRKLGIKIRLQDQPFEVLAALLERPGQLVTREQLQTRIWAGNTFVDFDRGLNKAVNRVREALGDLAATPRFIETQSKRGYRFIAPIAVLHADSSQHLLRSSLLPPPNTSFLPDHFALSRDGTRLAFIAADSNGEETLWVRDLSAATAQRVAETEGARMPFWSPDGRRVGFFAGGKLKTIDVSGGAVRILCDARVGLGGAWNSDDVILFAPQVAGPLYRVAARGGTPDPATPVPHQQSSQQHCWPVFPPRSDRFLFFVNRTGPGDLLRNGIYAGSLTSTDVHLLSSEIAGNVGFASDHMFFVAEGGLKAQAFDSAQAQLIGPVVPIVQHELLSSDRAWFHQAFSVSDPGTVVFQSRMDFAPEMVWINMDGNEETLIHGGYWGTAISPDGRFVAVSSEEFHDGRQYICVHDIERGVTSRLTDGGREWHPSWSPVGDNIIYDSTEAYASCTYSIPADGSGSPQLILEPGSIAAHVSADGALVCARLVCGWPHLEVRLPNRTESIMVGPGVEPQFSPDGKWLAYTEPGGSGIAVRPFPALRSQLKISAGRGAQPRWSRDGTKLFYISPDKKLMAVSFDPGSGRAGAPTMLFQTRIVRSAIAGLQFDVAPDGRFLINSLPAGPLPLTLLAGCNSLFINPLK